MNTKTHFTHFRHIILHNTAKEISAYITYLG